MNYISRPEYVEESDVHQLSPGQYLNLAQQAIARLKWQITGLDHSAIRCYIPPAGSSFGEVMIISVEDGKAVIRCTPVNEYYYDESLLSKSVAQYTRIIEELVQEQELAERSRHPMHREKYGALVPSKTYLVTPLLVYANVLVFAAMVLAGLSPISPTAQSLFLWGGNLRAAVLGGDWWRLLSYMFLHAGGMHLLMNMFALLYIGMFLEPLMGRFRFTAAYVLTGICAGLVSIAMHSNSVGVGASGAIFGMYGVFLSMLTTSHIQKTQRKTMMRSILFFVVYNLLAGMQGSVDNAAHIGGLVSGFLVGYAYYPGIARKVGLPKQMAVTAALAALLLLVCAVMPRLLS